ncbi:hypothetical protein AZ34_05885 [Hylemonella gracilis str. Niagara R]|uniref:DUF3299 domain-containing protein n=1 Tax=Hylemonella gracilis str. Niagara R TaxID=1458275 RepID=A0A016XGG2_9BURK|nr:DUF3299 domain-containing protein [Hylemonella gracilis]EYC50637.1 hypothetical protein AZ34_05885 [Hylemonella gracilis str. Niagara R]
MPANSSRPAGPQSRLRAWRRLGAGLRDPRLLGLGALLVLVLIGVFLPSPPATPDFRDPAQVRGEGHAAGRPSPTLPGAIPSSGSAPLTLAWQALAAEMSPRQREVLERVRAQSALADDDPRAVALYAELREAGESAPANPAMDGQRIRIPGYVVPLERADGRLKQFLLVPYHGACIHTPPPPANQIIHVHTATAPAGLRTMDAVWIEGVLRVENSSNPVEAQGQVAVRYQMAQARVVRY